MISRSSIAMKYLLFLAGWLCSFTSFAQLLDTAALQSQPIFESLEEAMKNPEKVYRLSLRGQKLRTVPEQLFLLKNLQELDLSRNKLKALPESMGRLTHLQVLNVSSNLLEELPDSIGQLVHLKKLLAFKNNLGALPKTIGQLESLEVLDLWSNNLSYFPDEMSQLQKLRWMDLRVILLNDEDQARIRQLVPHAKIFFSPSCKCVTGG